MSGSMLMSAQTSRCAKLMSSEFLRSARKDISAVLPHYSLMAKKRTDDVDETPEIPEPEHFLRAWRRFRKMTQRELAEAVNTSESVISELENRRKAMSLKWLYRLSKALNTKPGFIVEHDPNKLDTDILEIFAEVPEANKAQALQILSTFRRDGTNG